MMPTPPHQPYGYPSAPRRQRSRLPLVLAAVAGAVLLVVCGGLATAGAYLAGRDSSAAESSPADEPRYTAAEIAKRGLNGCTTPEAIKSPTGGTLERDAVVSTFPDEATALTDAQSLNDFMSDYDVKDGTGMLVGPYWTVNCSVRSDCEATQKVLGGRILE